MFRGVCVVFALFVAQACTAVGYLAPVETQYWADENFRAYRTYAWLPSDVELDATQPEDHRLHDLIRGSIDAQLAARRFMETEPDNADFLITYHCRVSEQLQVEVIDRDWSGSSDRLKGGSVPRRVEYSRFLQGSIVIDVGRPQDRRIVWRGVAQGRLSPYAMPEQLRPVVDRAVREMLADFPPSND